MLTVAILINGQPIVAKNAVNQSKRNAKGETAYKTDSGEIVWHDAEDGAVALAHKLLDTIRNDEKSRSGQETSPPQAAWDNGLMSEGGAVSSNDPTDRLADYLIGKACDAVNKVISSDEIKAPYNQCVACYMLSNKSARPSSDETHLGACGCNNCYAKTFHNSKSVRPSSDSNPRNCPECNRSMAWHCDYCEATWTPVDSTSSKTCTKKREDNAKD